MWADSEGTDFANRNRRECSAYETNAARLGGQRPAIERARKRVDRSHPFDLILLV